MQNQHIYKKWKGKRSDKKKKKIEYYFQSNKVKSQYICICAKKIKNNMNYSKHVAI